MKTLIAVISLLFLLGCASVPTAPKLEPRIAVLNDGQVFIGIIDEPCTNKAVLDNIKPEYQKHFKAGKVQGLPGLPTLNLCWADGENFLDLEPGLKGNILIFDEIGNYGPIPREAFQKAVDPKLNKPQADVRRPGHPGLQIF